MLALWISNPQQRSYMTLIASSFCAAPRRTSEALNLPLVLFSPIATFWPKADNSWCHCNVQIKLVNGLAVATAAPHLNDLRAARWRKLTLSNSQAISDPLFMIRGVAKTWGTRYRKILGSTQSASACAWLASDFR